MSAYSFLKYVAKVVLFPQRGKVRGLENLPAGHFIIAANHRSWYDPPLVVLALRKRIRKKIFFLTEKRIVRFIPRCLQNRLGIIPASAVGLKRAASVIKEGFPVGIFFIPRRQDPKKLSNNYGVAWLAKQTRVLVVPLSITGMVIYGSPIIFVLKSLVSLLQKKEIVIAKPMFFDQESNGQLMAKLRSVINNR